jgi:hypothetical protein
VDFSGQNSLLISKKSPIKVLMAAEEMVGNNYASNTQHRLAITNVVTTSNVVVDINVVNI